MKRCSRRVLPKDTPGISFDEQGVCNYCKTYQQFPYRGEEELLKLLDSHRGSNKYDCIVNISGGRDSSYVLLKLVKDYRMQVLAVNYENPYTHPQAKENIRNIVQVLNVDLVQFSLKNKIHQRLLKHYLKVWLRKPSPATVPMMCIGCRLLWSEVIRIARKYDIDCIISGGNPLEYSSFKEAALDLPQGATLKLHSPRNILRLGRAAFKNIPYFTPKYLPVTFKSFLFTNPYALGPKFIGHGIEKIDLFHFVRWNEDEVISRISSELGWNYPAERHTTWRFDCRVGDLKDYLYLKTLGITERADFYAKMIREGLITREDALARLEKEDILNPDIVDEFLTEGR